MNSIPSRIVILFVIECIFRNLILFSRDYYFPLELLSIDKRFFPLIILFQKYSIFLVVITWMKLIDLLGRGHKMWSPEVWFDGAKIDFHQGHVCWAKEKEKGRRETKERMKRESLKKRWKRSDVCLSTLEWLKKKKWKRENRREKEKERKIAHTSLPGPCVLFVLQPKNNRNKFFEEPYPCRSHLNF